MSFDNLINKFKQSTKQAADQMSKATRVAKLKMDVMTLQGEKARHCQSVGERTYELYSETNGLDGNVLRERVRHEFSQIERIDGRIRELESQIADLQAPDVAEADSVTDITEPEGEDTSQTQ